MKSKAGLVITTVVLTVLAVIIIVVVLGLILIYTGMPNVAATSPHGAAAVWILSTTADHSVEARARNIRLPGDYNQIDIRAGYRHYDEMCVMCHGAPGVNRQWVGEGLYPKPPHLYVSVKDMPPEEAFWIARNGIKDTGMPALAPTRSDDQIWEITALVKRLPELTPETYRALGQDSAGTEVGSSSSSPAKP